MRKVYILKTYDGQNSWTVGIFSSRKIAEAWKRHFDRKYPHFERKVLDDIPINFAPTED